MQTDRSIAVRTISARKAVSRFGADEDGSLIPFALLLFLAMFMAGGIAVDIVHHEYQRLRLQTTVDAALLAAADRDQQLEPGDVIADFFAKAGLSEYLTSTDTETENGITEVSAVAAMDLEPMFVRNLGVDHFDVNAGGAAGERGSAVEIAMVLDVSGSMNSYGRLPALKEAAHGFLDKVLAANEAGGGQASMSLIPYSTQVAMPDDVLGFLNLTHTHDHSNCVDFEAADFQTTALPTATRTQTGHFDPWNKTSSPYAWVCRNDGGFESVVLSGSIDELKDHVDSLSASGNTSTDIGIKWGAALLDPTTRPLIDDMIADERVNASFQGRPFDFQSGVTKVLIVMTDGDNTDQYKLGGAYSGDTLSDIWKSGSSWYVEDEEYGDRDRDGRSWEDYWDVKNNRWTNSLPSGATRMTWQDVWEDVSITYHADEFRYDQYGSSSDYYDWLYATRETVSGSTKDSRMLDICAAAKEQGVIIYTIGFQVSSSNASRLIECASTGNHYFDVDIDDIELAFTAVASSLGQLGLRR